MRIRPYDDKVVESEEETEEVEENMETGPIPNPEEEENLETGPSEVRPLRRSPRVKTAKNVKFVKSANTQEEGNLSMKEDDLEGIKYMLFMNMMRAPHVFLMDMMGTSQDEEEEDIYKILATEFLLRKLSSQTS